MSAISYNPSYEKEACGCSRGYYGDLVGYSEGSSLDTDDDLAMECGYVQEKPIFHISDSEVHYCGGQPVALTQYNPPHMNQNNSQPPCGFTYNDNDMGQTFFHCSEDVSKNKKDNHTGFVAIMKNQNGIVGIADSRGTIQGGYGLIEDTKSIRKIFRSEQFILVTSDASKYVANALNLSELIERILIDFRGTHHEFIGLLQERLGTAYFFDPDFSCEFIFGFKEDWEGRLKPEWGNQRIFYGSEVCSLSSAGAEYSDLNYENNINWSGDDNYVPKNPCVHPNWSVAEMKECCLDIMNSIVTLGNKYLIYNPVGGEIRVETLI